MLFSEESEDTSASLFGNSTTTAPTKKATSTSASSGLSGLFPTTTKLEGNTSLTYQAPKQPTPAKKEEAPALLYATTVTLFQYEQTSQNFANKGKVGAAVLGSRSSNKYQILLYKDNKVHLSVASISFNFSYTVQNNVYGGYTDDSKQQWSICFKSKEESDKFASYVVLCKSAANGFKSITYIDILVPPKGKAVVSGDGITIKYISNATSIIPSDIQSPFQVGVVLENSASIHQTGIKFKVGENSNKVMKGIEDAVIGMKKSGKRLVAIAPDSQIPFQKNFVQVVEVELIKKAKATTPAPQVPAPVTSAPATGVLPDLNEEDKQEAIKARMAKLGRPSIGMVPAVRLSKDDPNSPLNSTLDQISQKENEVPPSVTPVFETPQQVQVPVVTAPPQVAPSPMVTPTTITIPNPTMNPTLAPTPTPNQLSMLQLQQQQQQQPFQSISSVNSASYNPYQMGINQLQMPMGFNPMNPMNMGMGIPSTGYGQSHFPNSNVDSNTIQLLLESRQFHTDIKSTFNTITSKISEISTRIETSPILKVQPKSSEMSAAILLQNIQRIVEENEEMKADVAQKRDQIARLHEKHEKMIEEHNKLLEQRSDSLKETNEHIRRQIKELLEEKSRLEKELNVASLSLSDTERKLNTLNRQYLSLKAEHDQLLEESQKKIAEMKRENEQIKANQVDAESRLASVSSKLDEEKSSRNKMQIENDSLKSEAKELKESLGAVKKLLQEKEKSFSDRIATIQKDFDEEKTKLEENITQLQESLKKQRAASGMVRKEEIEKIEQDAENKWSNIFKQNELENKRKIENITAKYESDKLSIQQESYSHGRAAAMADANQRISSLQSTVEDLKLKLSAVSNNSASTPSSSVSSAPSNVDLSKYISKQEAKEKKAASVKAIMNQVYFSLYDMFEEEESYSGESVLGSIMKVIKETTLKLVSQDSDNDSKSTTLQKPQQSREDEDEEEEEDEEKQEEEKQQQSQLPQTTASTASTTQLEKSTTDVVESSNEPKDEPNEEPVSTQSTQSTQSLPVPDQEEIVLPGLDTETTNVSVDNSNPPAPSTIQTTDADENESEEESEPVPTKQVIEEKNKQVTETDEQEEEQEIEHVPEREEEQQQQQVPETEIPKSEKVQEEQEKSEQTKSQLESVKDDVISEEQVKEEIKEEIKEQVKEEMKEEVTEKEEEESPLSVKTESPRIQSNNKEENKEVKTGSSPPEWSPAVKQEKTPVKTSSLWEEDDSDSIFSNPLSSKSKKPDPPAKSTPIASTTDNDLFTASNVFKSTPSSEKKASSSLFGDDDDFDSLLKKI